MELQSADYLRHRIARFAAAIDEIRTHGTAGSTPADRFWSLPYFEQHGICELFSSLDTDPAAIPVLRQEFGLARERLRQLETDLGPAYRDKLRDELSYGLDLYCAAVCHAGTGSIAPDRVHALFGRDRVAVLLGELEPDFDLSDARHLLAVMEANLARTRDLSPAVSMDEPLPAACRVPAQKERDPVEG